MTAIERMMAATDPYLPDDRLFVEALQEALSHHQAHNDAYRRLCDQHGFGGLVGPADISSVPWVFVNVFKRHELLSVPREAIALNLTSSGTGGQKSQIFFDQGSLDRGLRMVDRCFEAMGLTAPEEAVNYLCFSYDPLEAAQVGTAFTDDVVSQLTGRREVTYALRWDAKASRFTFRDRDCLAALDRYQADGYPVRILGFPAFLHRLMRQLEAEGRTLQLGERSFVLTGGGWKTAEDEQIPKAAFIQEVEARLGIPGENVRDGFGLVEHGVPYLECAQHRFHVPAYARAFVRDVADLSLLPDGQVGFLQLVTPYLLSMPAISLLTSDLAVLARDCPCGRPTATIALMGRAGVRKNKGCAMTAAQMLK